MLQQNADRRTPRKGLPIPEVRKLMYQLLSGVKFCHSNRIIHRDLKPQNLLIDCNGNLKLADFGLARIFSLKKRLLTPKVVTLWYRSPELLLGLQMYDSSVDMWSVGCIFSEIVTGYPLFPGQSEIEQIFKIFRQLGTPDETVYPGVTQLPHFKVCFPHWPTPQPSPISQIFNSLEVSKSGQELLAKLLAYDPSRRICGREALQDNFFSESFPLHAPQNPQTRANSQKWR